MSDIGGIFTPTDLALIVLIICGPGLAMRLDDRDE